MRIGNVNWFTTAMLNRCCGRTLQLLGLAAVVVTAWVGLSPTSVAAQEKKVDAPAEVVVYASELPKKTLSEIDVWDDAASPGGKLVGTRNTGDELDPPPENDPHLTFTVPVQSGIPYRCWIHMKVGTPKGKSKANRFWVQFSDAVDKANKEFLKPGTDSYLTAQGPEQPGWTWVGCELAGADSSHALVYFKTTGEVKVRIQAGMEGAGLDQFLLSPALFLHAPPSEAIVKK